MGTKSMGEIYDVMPTPTADGFRREARAIKDANGLCEAVFVCGYVKTKPGFLQKIECLRTVSIPLRIHWRDVKGEVDYSQPDDWYIDIDSGIVRCPEHRQVVG